MILFEPGNTHVDAVEPFIHAVETCVHAVETFVHAIEPVVDAVEPAVHLVLHRFEAPIDASKLVRGCVAEHEKGCHDVVG